MVIKLRERLAGGHVHGDVFMGPDAEHLANCGRLVMRVDEWALFVGWLQLAGRTRVLREDCPTCQHGGHVGEQCLVAMASGDSDVFCMCGQPDGAERLLAEALDPFDVHCAEALAVADQRDEARR
jgi:hypothetical protein